MRLQQIGQQQSIEEVGEKKMERWIKSEGGRGRHGCWMKRCAYRCWELCRTFVCKSSPYSQFASCPLFDLISPLVWRTLKSRSPQPKNVDVRKWKNDRYVVDACQNEWHSRDSNKQRNRALLLFSGWLPYCQPLWENARQLCPLVLLLKRRQYDRFRSMKVQHLI